MTSRHHPGATLAAALAALAGCGKSDFPPLYPVRGKVAFEDGKPLTYGVIDFEAEIEPPLRATARVGPDGAITDVTSVLSNGKSEPGLAAGTHKVRLSVNATDSGDDTSRPAIPAKYTDMDTTDLRITVSPPSANVTITLKPGKK